MVHPWFEFQMFDVAHLPEEQGCVVSLEQSGANVSCPRWLRQIDHPALCVSISGRVDVFLSE